MDGNEMALSAFNDKSGPPRSRELFLTGFVLGEKAVKAAHESDLPTSVLALIEGAPKYAEGRGFRIEIRTKKDLEVTKKLAAMKMAN